MLRSWDYLTLCRPQSLLREVTSNAIRTCPTRGHGGRYVDVNVALTCKHLILMCVNNFNGVSFAANWQEQTRYY